MRRTGDDRKVYVFSFSAGGEVASELSNALGAENVPISEEGTAAAFKSRWSDGDAFVFIGALAIAVRSVAPLLEDKSRDPALVVVPEDGGAAIPVISGHIGLATDLARECAEILSGRDAAYIPTTASDRAGYIAPDLWASRRGYGILLRGGLVSLIMKLKTAGEISVWVDPILAENDISLPLPFGYKEVSDQRNADLMISPRSVQKLVGAKPQIVPRVITAGIGCRRGVPEEALDRVLRKALSANRRGPFLAEALAGFRTAEVKEDEEGLLRLAANYSLPLTVVPDSEILSMDEDFSPSAAARHVGLPGVSEPSAASAGALLGPRVAETGVTVALSISRPVERGELAVVGTGPGDARFVTAEARDAITSCEVLIGYKLYVDLLPEPWIRRKIVERYGMGEEEKRVRSAINYAERGYRVALVSGGDPTLFGLASLSLSMLPDSVGIGRVRVIPGITAAQAAGASLGAPYSNGLALISLSDYLQPWCDVEKALEGAYESGLAVAVYNPVSRGLSEKIAAVRRIFRGRRAILTRDAGRPEESSRELPADELDEHSIDMRTLVLILSPNAREKASPGKALKKIWLEARGYDSEISESPGVQETGPLGRFLVLGGTTEGRAASDAVMGEGWSVTVSVARGEGMATVPDGAGFIVGARNAGEWIKLMKNPETGSHLAGVIDATHPFAENASREIACACRDARVPLCRFVRPSVVPESAKFASSLDEALSMAIELTSPGDAILLAIGVNPLPRVLPRLRDARRRVTARMLPTAESMRRAEAAGLEPREIVAMWGAGGAEFNESLCRERGVRLILSKESGALGGIEAKALAAERLGIPLVLIGRPDEPPGVPSFSATDDLLGWCMGIIKIRKR
ncbi:MAG: precorrin-6A reductase [Synergistaceae bacterium]|jgi:cobalt-precorrin 5A hydrolase/precorrin-3B C17-methyltransferase|nr:precorrin-6A reductase [Synergistaceae bacterium]